MAESRTPTLYDFYADWCNPCKAMNPIIEQLSDEFKNMRVEKINVDDERNNKIVSHFGVKSIPTLIFTDVKGDIKFTLIGLKSYDEIKNLLLNNI